MEEKGRQTVSSSIIVVTVPDTRRKNTSRTWIRTSFPRHSGWCTSTSWKAASLSSIPLNTSMSSTPIRTILSLYSARSSPILHCVSAHEQADSHLSGLTPVGMIFMATSLP